MVMARRATRGANVISKRRGEGNRKGATNRKRCQRKRDKLHRTQPLPKATMPEQYMHELEPNKRLLMRDWLTREVALGQISGLRWLDDQKTLLTVPWLHGSRHGWQEGDCELYKRWALHTGKYEDTDRDSKRWKANFRCAINSLPDVKEQPSMTQKKGANAYRVYKFLPAKPKRSQCKRISRRSKSSNESSMPNKGVTKPAVIKQESTSRSPPDCVHQAMDNKLEEVSQHIKREEKTERVLDIFSPEDHSYAAMTGPVIPKVVEALNGQSLHQSGGYMYDKNPTPDMSLAGGFVYINNPSPGGLTYSSDSSCGGSSPRTDLDETDHQVTDMVTAWEMENELQPGPEASLYPVDCGLASLVAKTGFTAVSDDMANFGLRKGDNIQLTQLV